MPSNASFDCAAFFFFFDCLFEIVSGVSLKGYCKFFGVFQIFFEILNVQ